MLKKIYLLFALMCVSAMSFAWTGVAPKAGNFYIYNVANGVFLKATSTFTGNYKEATLFTLAGTGTYTIAYEDNGTKYVYESAGNPSWGTTNTNQWTFEANGGGYYIRHTDPSNSRRTRYIEFNGKQVHYPREDFDDNGRRWILVAEKEVQDKIAENLKELADYSQKNIDNGTDVTSFIINPSFETGTLEGWTLEGYSGDTGVKKNEGGYVTNGVDGNNLFNTWNENIVYSNPGTRSQKYEEGFPISQTIKGLPNGKYKITAKFSSYNENEMYLVANRTEGEKVRSDDKGNFVTADVEVEVTDGTLTIMATAEKRTAKTSKPTIGSAGSVDYIPWFRVDDFKLTYLSTQAVLKIGNSAPWGTFCAPFDVTMPSGISAYKVTAWDSTTGELTLDDATTNGVLAAGTPVIVNGSVQTVPFYGDATVTEDAHSDGYLHGAYNTTTQAPAGSYGLQKQNDKVAFYKASNGFTSNQYRAYLTLPNAPSAKVVTLVLDENTTSISSADAEVKPVAIFNANGNQLNVMKKGINIVKMSDGSIRKVMVK